MSDFVKLPNLMARGKKEFGSSLTNLSKHLKTLSKSGCIAVSLVDKENDDRYFITFSKNKSSVSRKTTKKPNLEIFLRSENWWKIANGKMSPLDLVLAGKLRIKGDIHFGTMILKTIGRRGKRFTLCEGD